MQNQRSVFRKFWNRVPVVIKSIVTGFLVSTFGVYVWVLFSIFIPVPWSLLAMTLFLWAYWKYFSGSWWPNATKNIRKENFRKRKLSSFEWKRGFLAAILFVIILHSGLALTFRFTEYPDDLFKEEYRFIEQIPVWMAWLVIIMSSLVAGICEETGYRGYMQVPLEKKYRPSVAVVVVSIIFVIVHLHQAWAAPILVQIFIISLLIGYFAYAFNSLIPGIIAHVTIDIFNFSYWWSDLLGKFTLKPISVTGVDLHFILTLVVFLTSLIFFVFINKKMIDRKKKLLESLAQKQHE